MSSTPVPKETQLGLQLNILRVPEASAFPGCHEIQYIIGKHLFFFKKKNFTTKMCYTVFHKAIFL